MYVCMYVHVYMYVHPYVCMYACMYVCTPVCMYICMYMCMYVCTCMYVYLTIRQVWSVLYPSWPALLLLLWAVVIWIIPRITPKNSLYYSSPVLVVYSLNLLILAFIKSINVTEDVWSWRSDVGRECEDPSWFLDCLSLALGTKVRYNDYR